MTASFVMGAFQKRGSRSKEQQWQRINEEGVSLRGAQATKQSRSKTLLRFARNDTFSSLGWRHHLGEYLFSGMHPLSFRTNVKGGVTFSPCGGTKWQRLPAAVRRLEASATFLGFPDGLNWPLPLHASKVTPM